MPTTTITDDEDGCLRHDLLCAFDRACDEGASLEEWTDLGEALEVLATIVAFGERGIRNRAAMCRATVEAHS